MLSLHISFPTAFECKGCWQTQRRTPCSLMGSSLKRHRSEFDIEGLHQVIIDTFQCPPDHMKSNRREGERFGNTGQRAFCVTGTQLSLPHRGYDTVVPYSLRHIAHTCNCVCTSCTHIHTLDSPPVEM